MSESEQEQKMGSLFIKQKKAKTAYANVDAKIKEAGERLEILGTTLRTSAVGVDYRDMLVLLEKAGIGASELAGMLNERNELWDEIQRYESDIAGLAG